MPAVALFMIMKKTDTIVLGPKPTKACGKWIGMHGYDSCREMAGLMRAECS